VIDYPGGEIMPGDAFPTDEAIYFDWDLSPSAGLSGCPVFLANGRVAGIATSSVGTSGGYKQVSAMRIDHLHELLTYHGLGGRLRRPVPAAQPRLDWGSDPHIKEFRKAVSAVRESRALMRAGDYRLATDRCNEALTLAPAYGRAFLQRSLVYLSYTSARWPRLPQEERERYTAWAFRDSDRGLRMSAAANEAWLVHAQSTVYVAYVFSDESAARDAAATLTKMLVNWNGGPMTDGQRAFAHNLRARCRVLLMDPARASADFDESVRAAPWEPRWYMERADFSERRGRREAASRDRAKAEALMLERSTPTVAQPNDVSP
jgi:tetratricopeptide (TPR) repeat protein